MEVHEHSVALFRFLSERNLTVGQSAVALTMTLGRLLSPVILEPEKESKFISDATEWMSLYLMEGKPQ